MMETNQPLNAIPLGVAEGFLSRPTWGAGDKSTPVGGREVVTSEEPPGLRLRWGGSSMVIPRSLAGRGEASVVLLVGEKASNQIRVAIQ